MDTPLKVCKAVVVFDYIIRQAPFFVQAHLRIDVLTRFFVSEVVSILEAFFLGCDFTGDQNHRPKPVVQVAFEEKRNFVDDDLVSGARVFANSVFRQRPNSRVDDSFELSASLWIVKNNFPEFLTIDGPVGLQDRRTELFDDFIPGRVSWFNDLAGQIVGVNDGRAEAAQYRRNGAFSRCDTTGQTD